MRRRKKNLIWIGPLALLGMIVFAFLGGQIVMHLWNWLLPPLFGWSTIGFWQALGLLVLCRILFGGFGCAKGSHSHRGGHRVRDRVADRVAEQWDEMTPEERERLGRRMSERWGSAPPGGGETRPL